MDAQKTYAMAGTRPSGYSIKKILVAGAALAVWILAVLLPVWAHAAPAALPPRPTPTPTPAPVTPEIVPTFPAPPVPERAPVGALIVLYLRPGPSTASQPLPWQTLHTAVQWQDRLGGWHTVEGWQGTLDQVTDGVGMKTWWVSQADLGTGPFRWVIYQGQAMLTASAPFHLPRASNQLVRVEVMLP